MGQNRVCVVIRGQFHMLRADAQSDRIAGAPLCRINRSVQMLSPGQCHHGTLVADQPTLQVGEHDQDRVDSSIHLAANLDALESVNSAISSITVTDPNALSLTSQQLSNDSSVLAKVEGLFDGSSGSATFNLGPNIFGVISANHMDAITNWGGSDTISYSSLLSVGGSATAPIAGQAQINSSTGVASFAGADSTLAQQISAVEHSLIATGAVAGQFAEWTNGNNTYVLITDGHSGVVNPTTGVEAGDVLIELVGVTSPSHVVLSHGLLVAH